MGLFGKKKAKVNLDETFKQQYKALNTIMQSAQEELDFEVKVASYQLVIEKYDQLLSLIDQGANFERTHFENLRDNVKKELDMIKTL